VLVKTLMLGKDCPGRICHSSYEAEARSLSEQDKANRPTRGVVSGMGLALTGPTLTGVDNKGASQTAYSRELGTRSKHIEVSVFAVRESVKLGENRPYHIDGPLNLSDWVTKLFGRKAFEQGRSAVMGCPGGSGHV
jgi:hypothetical protein